jgi:hypothetical protein
LKFNYLIILKLNQYSLEIIAGEVLNNTAFESKKMASGHFLKTVKSVIHFSKFSFCIQLETYSSYSIKKRD